ncbi:MAG: DUF1152 domain-containing protein [Nitrospinota bacterium]
MSFQSTDGFVKFLRGATRALVLGIGGGGDVVGTLPTARLLQNFGAETILGGVAWERVIFDPAPGSRKLEEVEGVRAIHPTVWWAGPEARTRAGVRFTEARVAELTGKDTILVTNQHGPKALAEGIVQAARQLNIDRVVGVDVGGDAIATGEEKGLRSPLCDAVVVAALAEVEREVPTLLGVLGYGSDAELSPEEIDKNLSELAAAKGFLGAWGITPDIADEMEGLAKAVGTEASALPVQCFRGEQGLKAIRQGTRFVRLSPVCAVTFYLDPQVVAGRGRSLAHIVREARSLEEANDALHAMGLRTELDLEREMASLGTQDYREVRRPGHV